MGKIQQLIVFLLSEGTFKKKIIIIKLCRLGIYE